MNNKRNLSYLSVVSIGIGGMVGGGIFAVLGLAVSHSKAGTPITFLFAGVIALFTAYSYSRLSTAFYSKADSTIYYYEKAFGKGFLSGFLNERFLHVKYKRKKNKNRQFCKGRYLKCVRVILLQTDQNPSMANIQNLPLFPV